eukprot:CAMPEP_0170237660 /NCGR_PEP_ID=MMETSP0116_2-20130129/18581_1 /TAXON_ID=400756 /ORGANISM="Durinskia baltica, Strain CSIRO CS-38" /LENGTH=496 /DNA_ID=CAMNT_0010488465 /DNA_START=68 /DNA_END=1555 /DNA_ORIENTATION=+
MSPELGRKDIPCHKEISPFKVYTRTGKQYLHAQSAKLDRVIDQSQSPWVIKRKDLEDFVGEDWDVWQEIAPMSLDMPFNCPLREVYLTSTQIYIVMPEITHGDLWAICYPDVGDDKALYDAHCLPKVRSLAAQMAFGLWELHQRGIMHRDVKGPNVMLLDTHGENITLIDYDGAVVGCKEKDGQPCSHDYEQGSPAYVSKSIAEGRGYGYEADWWSWAVVVCMIRFNLDPFGEDVASYPAPFWDGDAELEAQEPVLAQLLHLTIGVDSATLEQPPVRVAMESPLPEDHPVLNHDYWLAGRTFSTKVERIEAIREFWLDVCASHAQAPERQCAGMFQPKPAAVARRRCDNLDQVRCSCRHGACDRDIDGKFKEFGVDDNPAVETKMPGGKRVCCSRQQAWSERFPYGNVSFPGALCHEIFMQAGFKEKAAADAVGVQVEEGGPEVEVELTDLSAEADGEDDNDDDDRPALPYDGGDDEAYVEARPGQVGAAGAVTPR